MNPDLRSFLRSLGKDTLVDLLCEQAERDPDLRARLAARAAEADLTGVRDLLDSTARTAESVHVTSVLDTLQHMLDAGTQADVAPLARRTADMLIVAAAENGAPDATRERLVTAVSLYARACAARRPASGELAAWILRVAFDHPGWPGISLAEFAAALAADDIEQIRSAVDGILAEPGTADATQRRATARRLRLEIAEITGDVDTVVRLLSEELPRLDVSMKIVRVLRAAGRHAEAIAHAATALGKNPGAGRGPVVAELERARAQPCVDVVSGLLGAGEDDEAWKAAAAHPPAELIPVYRQHIEQVIEQRNPLLYARAADRLRRLRLLHTRAGTRTEFGTYLAELVERHRRKTRLLAEIRRARIALPKAVIGTGSS